MSDRTDTSCNDASRSDERVTTIRFALGVDDIEPREYEDACDALASLAADAAETQKLREQVDEAQRLMQMWKDEAAAIIATASCFESERNEARAERDAAVADRDRLAEALDLIGHGWDGDEFNDPADLVEKYASIALAARVFRCNGCDRIPVAGTDCSKPCSQCGGVYVIDGDECGSCIEGFPRDECPQSKRWCGHHCNHVLTHDACDWCGGRYEEETWVPKREGGSDDR